MGVRTRLEQALVNLLDNAVKFNRPGGEVRIEIGRTADGKIAIAISDTGHRYPFGGFAARIRALLPGRQSALTGSGRHGAGPLDRQARRRADEWHGDGGERAGKRGRPSWSVCPPANGFPRGQHDAGTGLGVGLGVMAPVQIQTQRPADIRAAWWDKLRRPRAPAAPCTGTGGGEQTAPPAGSRLPALRDRSWRCARPGNRGPAAAASTPASAGRRPARSAPSPR